MAPFDPFAFSKVVETTYGLMYEYKKAPTYATRLKFNLAMYPQLNALNDLNEDALSVPIVALHPVMTYDSYTLKVAASGAGVVGGTTGKTGIGSGFGIMADSGAAIDTSNTTLSIPKPSVAAKQGAPIDIFNRIKDLNVDRYGSLKWLADNVADITEGALWVQSNKGNFGSIFDFYSQYGASIIAVLNAKPLFADWEKTDLLNLTQGKLPAALQNTLDTRFYLDNLKAIAAGDLRAVGLTNFQTALSNMIADGINGANLQIDTSGFQQLLTSTFNITIPQGTTQDSYYSFLGKWFSGLPTTDTILSTITKKLGVSMPALFTGEKGVVPGFKSMAGDLKEKNPSGFAGLTKKFANLRVQLEKRGKNIGTYAKAIAEVPTHLDYSAKVTLTLGKGVKIGDIEIPPYTKSKDVQGDNIIDVIKQVTELIKAAMDDQDSDKKKIGLGLVIPSLILNVVASVFQHAFGQMSFYAGQLGGEIKGVGDDLVTFIGADVGSGILKDFGGLNLSSIGLGTKFTDIGKGFGDLNLDWKFPTLGG